MISTSKLNKNRNFSKQIIYYHKQRNIPVFQIQKTAQQRVNIQKTDKERSKTERRYLRNFSSKEKEKLRLGAEKRGGEK